MSLVILYRASSFNNDERLWAKYSFDVYEYRSHIPNNSTVIGRYSVLPNYKELETDLKTFGSKLINSYEEHRYIADFDYYWDVEEFTPKTYFQFADIPQKGGPFVVKGKTNSKKLDWNTKMFAKTKTDAINIGCDLLQDSMISEQGVIVRDFVEFKKLDEKLNGLPVIEEWRFFFYKNTMVRYGNYWETFSDKVSTKIPEGGLKFSQQIADIISQRVNFFVLDIAQKVDGSWMLIEVNDGQMSGLQNISPERFYAKLIEAVK